MTVWVAEINAVAAARPVRAGLDSDPGFGEASFPGLALIRGNGKCHMDRATSVVRWNAAARKMHRLKRMAAQQQQHATMADVVGAKPRIAVNAVQPENLLIERTGPLERVDIEHCFENAEKRRHLCPACAALVAGVGPAALPPILRPARFPALASPPAE